jgi:hypothetical protein
MRKNGLIKHFPSTSTTVGLCLTFELINIYMSGKFSYPAIKAAISMKIIMRYRNISALGIKFDKVGKMYNSKLIAVI